MHAGRVIVSPYQILCEYIYHRRAGTRMHLSVNNVAGDGDHDDNGGRRRSDGGDVHGDHRQRGSSTGSARGPGTVGRVLVQERAEQTAARYVQVGVVDA